jgi:two-component system chemotaxis response regulator CheY
MKCLIVEDELMSRSMLKEMLPASFDIDIVVNGEEAVEAFRLAHKSKRPYELIFMDIEMPVLNGNEALGHIREIEREMEVPPAFEVKVIMTTSHDEPKIVMNAFNGGGAFAYLLKPLDAKKLKQELHNIGLSA